MASMQRIEQLLTQTVLLREERVELYSLARRLGLGEELGIPVKLRRIDFADR